MSSRTGIRTPTGPRDLLRAGVTFREVDGYLDALPAGALRLDTPAARTMRWNLLPTIYEAAWRPIGFALWTGRTTSSEQALIARWLNIQPGEVVLDVACGPGNTTRRLLESEAKAVVGLDAAPAMLRRAVQDTSDERAHYVLGDASSLPFVDGAFDAVTCLGALYLVDEPFDVIAEIARVLAPGGRAVVLTSCYRGHAGLRGLAQLLTQPSGLRMFHRDEITEAFARNGLTGIEQDVRGFGQLVLGRRPA